MEKERRAEWVTYKNFSTEASGAGRERRGLGFGPLLLISTVEAATVIVCCYTIRGGHFEAMRKVESRRFLGENSRRRL